MVLDNVLIPWEDVFFYRHTKAAQYIRGTLHRYSAFPYVLRVLYYADMMIGAAMWNAKQTGDHIHAEIGGEVVCGAKPRPRARHAQCIVCIAVSPSATSCWVMRCIAGPTGGRRHHSSASEADEE